MSLSTIFFLLLGLTAALGFFIIQIWSVIRARRRKISDLITKEWNRVNRLIESNPKHAVVEADKLLELALNGVGRKNSIGTILKTRGDDIFSHLNDVWRVHKLRNRIVHEIGFEITSKDARDALRIFRRALQEAGITLPRTTTLV